MAIRLDVQPLAAEIASVINRGTEDKRPEWSAADHVRVLASDFIPPATAHTTAALFVSDLFPGDLGKVALQLGDAAILFRSAQRGRRGEWA